jgi:hypothetical protein
MEDQTPYEGTQSAGAQVRQPILQIYATDSTGHREAITDLYWFEENGVRDWSGHGLTDRYTFEIFVNGLPLQEAALMMRSITEYEQRQPEGCYPIETMTPQERTEALWRAQNMSPGDRR